MYANTLTLETCTWLVHWLTNRELYAHFLRRKYTPRRWISPVLAVSLAICSAVAWRSCERSVSIYSSWVLHTIVMLRRRTFLLLLSSRFDVVCCPERVKLENSTMRWAKPDRKPRLVKILVPWVMPSISPLSRNVGAFVVLHCYSLDTQAFLIGGSLKTGIAKCELWKRWFEVQFWVNIANSMKQYCQSYHFDDLFWSTLLASVVSSLIVFIRMPCPDFMALHFSWFPLFLWFCVY